MQYQNVKFGIFESRPNRFIANIQQDGESIVCHVKNTGRCGELLIPGARQDMILFLSKKREDGLI